MEQAGDEEEQRDAPSETNDVVPRALRPETAVYLRDAASKSFDRFNELDESVWRSLPFFAAVFGFAATLIGTAIPDLPQFDSPIVATLTHLFLVGAALSFAWAFRWFILIIKRRSYEYPAEDREVREFAESLTSYYTEQGLDEADFDAKVVHDLILVESAQLADAAHLNGKNTRERLNARSLTLQFMMIGFGLALANSITIFVYNRIYDNNAPIVKGDLDDSSKTFGAHAERANALPTDGSPNTAAGERRHSGCEPFDDQQPGRNAQEERRMTEATPTAPVPQVTPPKPVAPPPQRVEHSDPTPRERR